MTQLISMDLAHVALALSKAMQVAVPLLFFLGLAAFARRNRTWTTWLAGFFFRGDPKLLPERAARIERGLGRAIGFLSWKIGCDLGFFLVTGTNVWVAFTPAGLIPYTLGQYVIYRWFGQKMVLSGMRSPLAEEVYRPPPLKRTKPVARWCSKFLHEDMNATSPHVPGRRVWLKPFVDYFAMFVAWSLYSMGIFWAQTREINFQPFTRFPHVEMLGFYLSGLLTFILGYNLGAWGIGHIRRWRERVVPSVERNVDPPSVARRSAAIRLRAFRERFGIRLRHLGAAACGILAVLVLAIPTKNAVVLAAVGFEKVVFIVRGSPLLPKDSAEQIGRVGPTREALPDFSESERAFREASGAL